MMVLQRTNDWHAKALERAGGDREVALAILAQELVAAEDKIEDHLEWAMRERARRIAAEERIDAVREAVKKWKS